MGRRSERFVALVRCLTKCAGEEMKLLEVAKKQMIMCMLMFSCDEGILAFSTWNSVFKLTKKDNILSGTSSDLRRVS
ncbi:hypothetical protein EUGRSUZ_E00700 [Eucalyptus grandis]|uniref:Uncharacterized protein n=2 Tax=Eucalyptus grandis TaxID=71139 RepID=A0ACC3KUT4_EUCGR|nr:hypothetical protein EUGRSUZ_E00700 [Eucalyptus grandis]